MLKPYYSEKWIEAGCDEVGRGCLAGPVVAAAVILPKAYHHPLLKDSKQLSIKQRDVLSLVIKQVAVAWAIGEATHAEVDQFNVLQASYLAMHRAIESLHTLPELLLIDGNRFKPYPHVPHVCIIQGDGHYAAIAAASILAKTHRDAYMNQLSEQFPGYGWEKNVGYPTAMHRHAIEQLGITPYHRQSFKLIKN